MRRRRVGARAGPATDISASHCPAECVGGAQLPYMGQLRTDSWVSSEAFRMAPASGSRRVCAEWREGGAAPPMARHPCLQRRRCFGNAQVTLEKAVLDSVIGANRTGELSRQVSPPSRDRARARTAPTARTRVRARIHTAAALLHTRRQVPPPLASPADGHRLRCRRR